MEKGDRIGIVSRNSPEYIAVYLGILRAGCIAVDINYQNSIHEIKTIVNHCGIKTVIVENSYAGELVEALGAMPPVQAVIGIERRARGFKFVRRKIPPQIHYAVLGDILCSEQVMKTPPAFTGEDLAAIVYTTGTAGRPKGVMLSHENILANARSIIEYLRLSENDRTMVLLPFCYCYGKSLFTTHLMAGGSLVLENSFMHPQTVFKKMIEEEATGFAGVPATFAIMLQRSNFCDFSFPALRYVTQGGGAMPPHHAQELAGLLPGTRVYSMYGQTEATAWLTCLDPDDLLNRPGSIGKPVPGVEIMVVTEQGRAAAAGQEGEIVARGKNVMAGYWNDPEETKKVLKEGWLYTGDLGTMDKDGYLSMAGRRSDMIKRGAHRISPKEIEEVIHEMDPVHEASVVGVHDAILGETIRAVVVLKQGHVLDAHAVQRHCQSKLAPYKIPQEVLFVDALPRTNSGKVMRSVLKNNLITGLPRSVSPTVLP
jgi:acyl-CoA synthetase (AMP-forming)/AMP-acid ligase II